MEKTVIITGASGSMGAAASKALAEKGFGIVMACRNMAKAAAVRETVLSGLPAASVEMEELHLDSFASIRDFASRMEGRRIYGLFNNAGVMPRDYGLTEDGFERTIAVNYLGPFLLSRLLLPCLGDGGHVVNMVSLTCRYVAGPEDFIDVDRRKYRQLRNYAESKLALMYFSIELARREPGIVVNVADPGIVSSNMIDLGRWFDPLADALFKPLCKSPESGARPAVNAMCSGCGLELFKGRGHGPVPSVFMERQDSAKALWTRTEEIFRERNLI